MTPRDRFLHVLRFARPDPCLPLIEWAPWWDATLARWTQEGLPPALTWSASLSYFGLDRFLLLVAAACSPDCPAPASYGAPLITDEASYDALLPYLYTEASIDLLLQQARALKAEHDAGDLILRLWLDGFFWFPRTLLGIEGHLFAFYDQSTLLHRINSDLAAFNLRVVERLFPVLVPDMVGFAEDMSYNHGPMLSSDHFAMFLRPYYQRVIPAIKHHGVKVFVDSDGDVTSMIPWLMEAGIDGVYPLEKQAGVDLVDLRRRYPHFLLMGGYDKRVMSQGADAMRGEFERLLPVMASGGYLPSVDHQTPPEVSLADYHLYLQLFQEYARKAVVCRGLSGPGVECFPMRQQPGEDSMRP
jgi:hypothetical protein